MKRIRTLGLAVLLGSMLALPVWASSVSYPSILNGTVATVVPVGAVVHEGDVLVTVQSLAGPIAAARAKASGVVQAVQTAPGEAIQQGTVVVIVESK